MRAPLLPRPTGPSARRATATLVALALAAGAAGCGGDDEDTATTGASTATTAQAAPTEAELTASFKQGYSDQRTTLNAITTRMGDALQSASEKTNAQIVDELGGIERELAAGVERLKTLRPPASVAADFQSTTRTADGLVRDLGDIVSAARTGDPEGAKSATQRLVGRLPTLSRSTQAISSKLGLPSSSGSAGGTTTAPAPAG